MFFCSCVLLFVLCLCLVFVCCFVVLDCFFVILGCGLFVVVSLFMSYDDFLLFFFLCGVFVWRCVVLCLCLLCLVSEDRTYVFVHAFVQLNYGL